jgi:8-oxo-dGTP pyrophosphatase MutT (NUDIX family)
VHRQALLQILERYVAEHPAELGCVARIRELVRERRDCFDRTCLPGHVTASAWILSADRSRFLLTHHRKLGRWLQLGGHADGDPDVLSVALREAREESGIERFAVLSAERSPTSTVPLPIDVDVHRIPARAQEPEHEHHDIRFLLVAARDQQLEISDESNELAWFDWSRLGEADGDESLLRMARKARRWRAESSPRESRLGSS